MTPRQPVVPRGRDNVQVPIPARIENGSGEDEKSGQSFNLFSVDEKGFFIAPSPDGKIRVCKTMLVS